MIASARRRINSVGIHPAICGRIVSAAGVQIWGIYIFASPSDHFATSPDCCVIGASSGRVRRAGTQPTIGGRVVSPTGIQETTASAPDDHLAAGPYRRMPNPP
jgi:hypothetical protein